MLILGIESSCDETGVALYEVNSEANTKVNTKGNATTASNATKGLLAHRLHSQIAMHAAYGGVVPELASRDHIRRLIPLIEEVLHEGKRSLFDLDAVAVTEGPGLGGALMVGNSVAAGLGFALGKPVIGIHHLEGHLLSPLIDAPDLPFPFVALLVSGGHTQLMAVEGVGRYRLLGETVDDAAGEAFDKTATLLGLPYPGGPSLAKLADQGDPNAYKLPRPMLHSGDLDFSFSGLKTAVLTLKSKLNAPLQPLLPEEPRQITASTLPALSSSPSSITPVPISTTISATISANIAASFQAAIVDVLVAKSLAALKQNGMHRLVVSGGVGANKSLREKLTREAAKQGAEVFYPPLALCTDNGAMIAFAAALRIQANPSILQSPRNDFSVRARWNLETV